MTERTTCRCADPGRAVRGADAIDACEPTHDAVTDLPMRGVLMRRLEALCGAGPQRRDCAVLRIDLTRVVPADGPPDTLLDTRPDEATVELLPMLLADRLRRQVRMGDTVARLGADAYAVIMTPADDRFAVEAFANRLARALGRQYDVAGRAVAVRASVGIARAPYDAVDADRLLDCAEHALAQACRDGGHRFYEPALDGAGRTRRTREAELRDGLEAGRLSLRYRPIVSFARDRVVGVEALPVWRCPTRGVLAADAFMPLVDEFGLAAEFGDRAIRDACRAAVRWPSPATVALDVSSQQVRGGALLRSVTDALQETGLAASRLELEVPESVLMHDSGAAHEVLGRLRALGVRIALDHFGIGYASLACVRAFPFDAVKIDRAFVAGIGREPDATAMGRAVTGVCAALGIAAAADGVASVGQLDRLRAEGFAKAQGEVFGPDVAAEEVPRAMRGGIGALRGPTAAAPAATAITAS